LAASVVIPRLIGAAERLPPESSRFINLR